MHINSVFTILAQMGVGPKNGYSIRGPENTWYEFTSNNIEVEMVKSYVVLKVRMLFDPPSSSSTAEAIKQNISELEWRLSISSEFMEV